MFWHSEYEYRQLTEEEKRQQQERDRADKAVAFLLQGGYIFNGNSWVKWYELPAPRGIFF